MNNRTLGVVCLLVFVVTSGVAQRSIRVLSPNGSENWIVGDCDTITWTWSGGVTKVKIDYSTNLGSTWTAIEALTTCDSLYVWNIPNIPCNQTLVRITDYDSTSVSDVSDNAFNLRSNLVLNYPAGGESLPTGGRSNITWTASRGIARVKIDYSTNAGTTWTAITSATQNDGIFPWNVPNTPSDQGRVKITDVDVANTNHMSLSNFVIAAKITVTYPNGGENLTVGSSQNIAWTSPSGITQVRIEYTTNSGSTWTTIASSAPNNGVYAWETPNVPCSQCRVKVTDYNNANVTDVSDSDFRIASSMQVVSPNGGERLRIGTIHYITWNAPAGISRVAIDYSTNSGTSWTSIHTSWVNRGSYGWNIPNTPSNLCLVRVSDVDNSTTIRDVSDSNFIITATFIEEVNSPVMPLRYYQSQNFPNPLSRRATIKFSIPIQDRVRLKVYNAAGEVVRALVDETKKPGSYSVNWDGRDERGIELPSGVYFYKLETNGFVDTKKAVILR